MTKEHLGAVRAWANERLATGGEPPWSWYQLMKLREALDAILAGMDATRPLGSPQSGEHQERRLRLVADADQPDSAPRHPDTVPVRLPM